MAGEPLATVFTRIQGLADAEQFKVVTARAARDLAATAVIRADATRAKPVIEDFRKRLLELAGKVATARLDVTDKDAIAKLAAMQVRLIALDRRAASPKITVEGTARAEASLLGLDAAFDRVTRAAPKLESAAGGVGSSMSGMATPMAGVAALAVGLSPVIVTLGLGLTGFGAAALAVSKNQALMKQTLGPLKTDYAAFVKELQPTVLADFGKAAGLASHLLAGLEPVSKATGQAIGLLLGRIDTEFQSGTWQKFFTFAAKNAGPDMKLLADTIVSLADALPGLLEALQPVAVILLNVAKYTALAVDDLTKFGIAANVVKTVLGSLAGPAGVIAAQIPLIRAAFGQAAAAEATFSKEGGIAGTVMQAIDRPLNTLTTGVAELTAALRGRLGLDNSLIETYNDLATLQQALKGSHDRVGLLTQSQRDSFAAWNTYIAKITDTASKALTTGKNVGGATKAIHDGLPTLERAAKHNHALAGELAGVLALYNKLRAEKAIHEIISVTGTGRWAATSGELPGQPGMHFVGRYAAGGLVPGAGRRDTVPAVLTPGEFVLPAAVTKSLWPALAPYARGFAAGGLVPAFSGTVAGLAKWTARENLIAERTAAAWIAMAETAQMAAKFAQAFSSFGAGPGGGAPSANAALARRLFPQWAAGAAWDAWNYVAMRESGWNQFARNPSSGAYGIPQALPPTKMPFAAQAAGGSNPTAQIRFMAGYMAGRYNGPIGAAWHERAFNWYGGGGTIMEPILGIGRSGRLYGFGERGRERVVPEGAATAGAGVEAQLARAVEILERVSAQIARLPRATGAATADSLNGVARMAAARGRYT